MRYVLVVFLTLFCTSLSQPLSAQTSDEELATYYYQNGEYEKAILYFEDIYKKKSSEANFRFYLNSLKELNQLEEAEKLVKKHLKTYKNKLELYVEMGLLQELQGRNDEANENYAKAIKDVSPARNQIIELATAFTNADKTELALKTYEKGRKELKGAYPFSYEIASIYGSMGDHERMINEYLELLRQNKGYLRSVQNNLNRSLDFTGDDERVNVLKTGLLKNVQKYPEQDVFYEMLIWLFTQRKEFNAAFIQAKAIDKRQGEDGKRLVSLASLCTNNEKYDIAAKCYAYLVDEKGKDSRYYETARTLELISAKKALAGAINPSHEDIVALDSRFDGVISELGQGNAAAARLMRERALLNAFYLNENEKAITMLDEAINMPSIDSKLRAQCKLDLGDILLAEGYIWDASLYYSQVEKDFKEDVLGFDAKYRNARISYYAGDFDWAQGQLDVLKASTSKLISNDAMDLSLLITDNLSLDTILEPMQMFARADLLTFQNKFVPAITTLDSITNMFPGHTLTDEIIYQKSKIAYKKGEFEESSALLNEILTTYFDDILADNALFELAEMNEKIFKDEAKAMELYEKLILDYPASLYVIESRKRFRALRGDVPVEEQEGITPINKIDN